MKAMTNGNLKDTILFRSNPQKTNTHTHKSEIFHTFNFLENIS
jgi:hypothetical protein